VSENSCTSILQLIKAERREEEKSGCVTVAWAVIARLCRIGEVVPVHAIEAYKECRGIAPLILNLGAR
jgi:hypothetical protein